MFFPNGNGFLASALVRADRLIDGVVLEGDGTVTMPDGTIQRPGVEKVTVDITGAGSTITHGASRAAVIFVKMTSSGGTLTLTSTPTIEAGTFDGQILTLRNDDGTAQITLQDDPTIASALELNGGAAKVVGTKDQISFQWNASSSKWHQLTTLQAD